MSKHLLTYNLKSINFSIDFFMDGLCGDLRGGSGRLFAALLAGVIDLCTSDPT